MTMLRDESNTVAFNDWVELSKPRKRESGGRERSDIVVVDV